MITASQIPLRRLSERPEDGFPFCHLWTWWTSTCQYDQYVIFHFYTDIHINFSKFPHTIFKWKNKLWLNSMDFGNVNVECRGWPPDILPSLNWIVYNKPRIKLYICFKTVFGVMVIDWKLHWHVWTLGVALGKCQQRPFIRTTEEPRADGAKETNESRQTFSPLVWRQNNAGLCLFTYKHHIIYTRYSWWCEQLLPLLWEAHRKQCGCDLEMKIFLKNPPCINSNSLSNLQGLLLFPHVVTQSFHLLACLL